MQSEMATRFALLQRCEGIHVKCHWDLPARIEGLKPISLSLITYPFGTSPGGSFLKKQQRVIVR
jgi:hypothetical protein